MRPKPFDHLEHGTSPRYFGYYDRKLDDLRQLQSIKFQNLVDELLKDGALDKSEATVLVREHNLSQARSRELLLKLLDKHGLRELEPAIHKYAMTGKSIGLKPIVPERPEPNIGYAYRVSDTPAFIPKGQKTRFVLIVLPALIVVLLYMLGVI